MRVHIEGFLVDMEQDITQHVHCDFVISVQLQHLILLPECVEGKWLWWIRWDNDDLFLGIFYELQAVLALHTLDL